MPAVRHPARAGSFYAAEPGALRRQVEACFLHSLGPGAIPEVAAGPPPRLLGLVSPHAGLMYSGPAAAWGYSELAREGTPDLVVLVGPNHSGLGSAAAVSAADCWRTPLGEVAVSRPDTERLLEHGFSADDEAHRFEHALEVQLPCLQFLYGERVPPMVFVALRPPQPSLVRSAAQMQLDRLAGGLASLLADRSVVMIASSDLSHFLPAPTARELDMRAVDQVLALEADRLLEVVDEHDISMCGALAVALVIKALSGTAHTAALLTYYNSGDISGDYHQVVGYASVALRGQLGAS